MDTHPSVTVTDALEVAGPKGAAGEVRRGWYVGLAKRLMVAAAGLGVFVFVASVVDPQLSPAEERARFEEMRSALTPQQQAQLEHTLVSRRHHKGWPLVGLLEGREYYTLAYDSPDGPMYTVCSLAGQVLLADLPADDVYRAFPTLDLSGMRLDPAEIPMGAESGPLMLAEPRVQPLD